MLLYFSTSDHGDLQRLFTISFLTRSFLQYHFLALEMSKLLKWMPCHLLMEELMKWRIVAVELVILVCLVRYVHGGVVML